MRQQEFYKSNWRYRYSHGGSFRRSRAGRKARPLSTKDSLHLVFKANRERLKSGFRTPKNFTVISALILKYATKFYVKIEQVSVQGNHIHFLIRTTRRSNYQNFFRVLAGQIAQVFEREKWLAVTDTPKISDRGQRKGTALWLGRPFTRVIKGRKNYETTRNYIQLNEQEARGRIPYRKTRLRGLKEEEWEILWR